MNILAIFIARDAEVVLEATQLWVGEVARWGFSIDISYLLRCNPWISLLRIYLSYNYQV